MSWVTRRHRPAPRLGTRSSGTGTVRRRSRTVSPAPTTRQPGWPAREVARDALADTDRVSDRSSRHRRQTLAIDTSVEGAEVLVWVDGRAVMAGEMGRLVEIVRQRLEHGHDPERRLQPPRPCRPSGEQLLRIADPVHGDDDVACPIVGSTVLSNDHQRLPGAGDEDRTDGMQQPGRDLPAVVAGDAEDTGAIRREPEEHAGGIRVDDHLYVRRGHGVHLAGDVVDVPTDRSPGRDRRSRYR